MNCPCKNCEKKGCGSYHDNCKEYLEFVQWRKFVNENSRKEKNFYKTIKRRKNHG